jgi:hypothetical protein
MIIRGYEMIKRNIRNKIKYCKSSYNPNKPFAFDISKKENKKQDSQ